MSVPRRQFARLFLLLLAGCLAVPAWGQGVGQGPRKAQRQRERLERQRAKSERAAPPGASEGRGQRGLRGALGLPSPWMERLQDMGPEQQERFLQNNERFKNLPPERQAQIRRRLQLWNSLTPEQRQAVRERQRVWQQMSPEQQRHVREDVLPKWRQLPLDRRQAILQRLRALRDLSPDARAERLKDENFLKGMAPEDRDLLRDLSSLRVGAAPEPPPESP